MRHEVAITLTLDTYSADGCERAPRALMTALATVVDLFHRQGIRDTGAAISNDDVHIRWTASQKDTTQ